MHTCACNADGQSIFCFCDLRLTREQQQRHAREHQLKHGPFPPSLRTNSPSARSPAPILAAAYPHLLAQTHGGSLLFLKDLLHFDAQAFIHRNSEELSVWGRKAQFKMLFRESIWMPTACMEEDDCRSKELVSSCSLALWIV